MDIDFNAAMNELVDDETSPATTPEPAATEAAEASDVPAAPAAGTARPAPAATSAPEPAVEPVDEVGATTGPAPEPDAIDVASAAPISQPVTDAADRKRLAIASGTAALAVLGAVVLWPSTPDDTTTQPVAATPAASTAAASQTPPVLPLPSTSTAPGAATPTPRVAPTPAVATWAWTGTDPAATTIDEDQARQRCGAKASDQVVSPKGTRTFRPGMTVRLGPRTASVPANGAVPTGWRTCILGYQRQPVAAVVGDTELTRDPAKLARSCAAHTGFDFTGWRPALSDARFNPRTNTITDASIAFNGPGGWAVGCEVSAGADAATLTFLPPTTTPACPRVSAAPMGRPGGGGGRGDGHGNHGGRLEGPGGALYWVTAFGRVPNPDGVGSRVASGGYDVGKVAEAAAMVRTGGGLAVANHTWKPSQQAPDEPGAAPVLSFFDKGGTKLFSCTPA